MTMGTKARVRWSQSTAGKATNRSRGGLELLELAFRRDRRMGMARAIAGIPDLTPVGLGCENLPRCHGR